MEIDFRTRKLARSCNSQRECARAFGERSRLVMRRLEEIASAETLAELALVPQTGLHALKEDRAGQFAVNVGYPYRMVLVPAHDPVPKNPDGGIDLTAVTAVRVVEVVDYHG